MPAPIELTSTKKSDRLKEMTDRLEQGIAELFDSERYMEYLRVMSRFHHYSFNNTLLIAMQMPGASYVAGFSTWKNKLGRTVKKGEKGIRIFAPTPYKKKVEVDVTDRSGNTRKEEKEVVVPAFKVVSVFDYSQTEGKELPEIASDLTDPVEDYDSFFSALKNVSPVPIAFEDIAGASHGYYNLVEKRIAIKEGMSESQTLKTLVHEIAHAKLHDFDIDLPPSERPQIDRQTKEVQAESVAYCVCQHFGLDTSEYTFGYVAGWSSGRELKELKASLEIIRNTADEIITGLEDQLLEMRDDQAQEDAFAGPTLAM